MAAELQATVIQQLLVEAETCAKRLRLRVQGRLLIAGDFLAMLGLVPAALTSLPFMPGWPIALGGHSRIWFGALVPLGMWLCCLALRPTDRLAVRLSAVACALLLCAMGLVSLGRYTPAYARQGSVLDALGFAVQGLVMLALAASLAVTLRPGLTTRQLLLRLWTCLRIALATLAASAITWLVSSSVSDPAYTSHPQFPGQLCTATTCAFFVVLSSEVRRGRVLGYIASISRGRSDWQAANVLSMLLGGRSVEQAMQLAEARFRVLPIERLRKEDLLGSGAKASASADPELSFSASADPELSLREKSQRLPSVVLQTFTRVAPFSFSATQTQEEDANTPPSASPPRASLVLSNGLMHRMLLNSFRGWGSNSSHVNNFGPSRRLSDCTVPANLGECDAFVSHSWGDAGDAKWAALSRWAEDFRARYHRSPTIWLDKACIDQNDIDNSLAFLPIFLAGCKRLLVLPGATYTSRLWCLMEMFTFVQIGRDLDDMIVLPLSATEPEPHVSGAGSRSEHECDAIPDATVDSKRAQCFKHSDRHNLLAAIEASYGTCSQFDKVAEQALTRSFQTAKDKMQTRKRLRNLLGQAMSRMHAHPHDANSMQSEQEVAEQALAHSLQTAQDKMQKRKRLRNLLGQAMSHMHAHDANSMLSKRTSAQS